MGFRELHANAGQGLGLLGTCTRADLSSGARMFSQPRAVTVQGFLSFLGKNQREPASGYSKLFSEHVLGQAQLPTDFEFLVIC